MSRKVLISHPVGRREDVREFFDGVAGAYEESHGNADQLLRYRLDLLTTLLPERRGGLLVEIGCGPGHHLLSLAERFDRAVGLDLSPAMIARAERFKRHHPLRHRLCFAVDPAEELVSLDRNSVDVIICVGAFEHMLEKDRVLRQVGRTLKAGGRFVCLTLNGGYVWYTHLAQCLGCEVRHLSSDRFVTAAEFRRLLTQAGLGVDAVGYWTFVPRGDMPPSAASILNLLDTVGRLVRMPAFRGGLYVVASPRPAA